MVVKCVNSLMQVNELCPAPPETKRHRSAPPKKSASFRSTAEDYYQQSQELELNVNDDEEHGKLQLYALPSVHVPLLDRPCRRLSISPLWGETLAKEEENRVALHKTMHHTKKKQNE